MVNTNKNQWIIESVASMDSGKSDLRRERQRKRMAFKRRNETPQQRKRRLETVRMRSRITRQNETPEERVRRLQLNRERMAKIRQSETAEKRAERRQHHRVMTMHYRYDAINTSNVCLKSIRYYHWCNQFPKDK